MLSIGKHFKASNTAKGTYGELAVKRELERMGYRVRRGYHTGYDLKATHKQTGVTFTLEIKYSSCGQDGKYRATTIKKNSTDHRKSDYIVFLCHARYCGGQVTPFIIPTTAQGNKSFLCVTSNPTTYKGYLAQYRNAWGLLS